MEPTPVFNFGYDEFYPKDVDPGPTVDDLELLQAELTELKEILTSRGIEKLVSDTYLNMEKLDLGVDTKKHITAAYWQIKRLVEKKG